MQPDVPANHDNLGLALSVQGKLDEAIAEFRTAIRLHPNKAVGHINLGKALHNQGKLDDAIAEYRATIRLQPDRADAHDEPRQRPARPGQARSKLSPNTARRSGSSPTTPWPMPASAAPCR